jgi:hypothetical protein
MRKYNCKEDNVVGPRDEKSGNINLTQVGTNLDRDEGRDVAEELTQEWTNKLSSMST